MSTPSPFHGKAYRYRTPEDGEQIIGVCQFMQKLWAVCWFDGEGRRHSIKSKGLPQTLKPETAQVYLDLWAELHKLPEVP